MKKGTSDLNMNTIFKQSGKLDGTNVSLRWTLVWTPDVFPNQKERPKLIRRTNPQPMIFMRKEIQEKEVVSDVAMTVKTVPITDTICSYD